MNSTSPHTPTEDTIGSLEQKYHVLSEIGDGSFGSVSIARVRGGRELVAIKTMKKPFDNFSDCLRLREVQFLRNLPPHENIVPLMETFLDPRERKLHLVMENLEGNLYQLMKSRESKPFDQFIVQNILHQILSGLEHIHLNNYFHRDIKPENILVSTIPPGSMSFPPPTAAARFSNPKTRSFIIKLADFGLARELKSRPPYTTYVSTRWYRAPEVLLRATEYSAPVDIWAMGAMAVELCTLRPLFPGQNEVDQIWRVCEMMGTPGQWFGRDGRKFGGGKWREGARLAASLGFRFPVISPQQIDTILPSPWPSSLAALIGLCLMWDPRARPTTTQCLEHDYFRDLGRLPSPANSVKRSPSPLFSRRASLDPFQKQNRRQSKSGDSGKGWFRTRNGNAREHTLENRQSWHSGANAPVIPQSILPSIKPISPLADSVNAEVNPSSGTSRDPTLYNHVTKAKSILDFDSKGTRKVARQLSDGSNRTTPTESASAGFFSHLRKKARRLRTGQSMDQIDGRLEEEDSRDSNSAFDDMTSSDRSGTENTKATDYSTPSVRGRQRISRKYEIPDEEDELLEDALLNAARAMRRLESEEHTVGRRSYCSENRRSRYDDGHVEASRSSIYRKSLQNSCEQPLAKNIWPTPPHESGYSASCQHRKVERASMIGLPSPE